MPAIKESLEGRYSIPLHEDGKGYREYIYVKNIPPVIDLILEKGDRTYNVTLNDGYTVKELIETAQEVTGKTCTTHQGDRPGMDKVYQMSNERIISLGWKPLYTFEQGLTEYLHEETI
jgi:dTDP-glucose 4,6-dehydratase